MIVKTIKFTEVCWIVCEARTCVESTVECRPLGHTIARPAPCALGACSRLLVC